MSKDKRKRIGLRGWLVIGSTSLLTALILLLVALFYTEAGLRWAVAQAETLVPGELRIDRVSGQLAGPLRLEGIRFRHEDRRVTLESLEAEWRPGLLLFGKVHLDRLDLTGLRVHLPPAQDDSDPAPPTLPDSVRLPLRITIRALHLADLSVLIGEKTVMELDELALDGHAGGHRIQLYQLTASGPWLDVDAEGRLEMAGDWPLTISGDWRLSLPDLPEMAGSTHIEGDQRQLAVEQLLKRPFHVSARGEVRQPLAELQAELDIAFRNLEPALLFADAPPARLTGRMRFSGGLDRFRLRGHVDATDTPWGDLGLRGDVSLPADLDWLDLHLLELDHQQHPMQVEASGELRDLLSDDPFADLTLNWQQLAWPLTVPEYVSAAGEATLSGRLSDYRLQLATRLGWLGHHPDIAGPVSGELHARLAGNRQRADIESLNLQVDEGPELDFSGQADWSEQGEFVNGDFRVAGFNPGRLRPDWPGLINAEGHVRFNWGGSTPAGRLQLASLEGRLIGQELSGRGSLIYGDDQLGFEGFRVSLGDSHLRADGTLSAGGRSAIRFDLALDNLAQFPLDMAGKLRADGALAGSPDSLDIELTASGEGLRYQVLSADAFQLDLDITDSARQDSRIVLTAETIQYQQQRIQRLELQGDGRRQDHRLSLIVEQDLIRLGASVAGELSAENDWRGEVVDLRISNEAVGDWGQRAPTPMALGPSGGQLETLCLESAGHDGELCFSGRSDEQGHWRAAIEGRGFPLALLLDREASGVDIEGELDLTAQARDEGEGMYAEGRVDFSPGAIRQRVDDEPVALMAFDGGHASLDWTPTHARAELSLDLSEGGHLRAWGELPSGVDGRLQGRLDANIPQLGLLPVLVAEVGRAEGQLLMAVDIDGRLNNPAFSGDVRVVDAELSLPDLGITAEAVNIHVAGGMQSLNITAAAKSGDGDLQFEADLDRLSGGWQGSANLSGDRFLGLNIPDARVRISPDLNMSVSPGRRLDITGELHVPWARITPRDLRTAVQVSPDEVMVGEILEDAAANPESNWSIHSSVRTTLGDDVHFDGYGLTGNIVGALTLRDQPGALTRATGELEIRDGEYQTWGQRLQVERGRLFFSDSPVSDPALDIRAVRRPRNVVVGVNIRGTLRHPEVEVFSDPHMQQSEQLSYLITGRPLDDGGEEDMDLIREASLALQVAGGGYVGRRLGDRLGVDTVTIEGSEAAGETSVVFGEYISPRLFISYGIGLFEGINVFRIRYEISSRWFLEAQTGPRSGADFIYSLERG